MKKIPTLFVRKFENHRIVDITDEITPGCEEAFKYGNATVKIDGSCCYYKDGVWYKRYDAKKGKKVPEGAIPCCDPDPITGHWPHWVKIDFDNPADKWFVAAIANHLYEPIDDCTYEAVGPHFQGNPMDYKLDVMVRHGRILAHVRRDFEGVKQWLENNEEEGLVFWDANEDGTKMVPVCKIKRSDFGLPWPVKRKEKRK